MKKIIIFIGPPGSGKGTQAKLLAKKYNYIHISTGVLLRALNISPDIAPDEKEALDEMKQGRLVPDWLIYHLVFKEIKKSLGQNCGVVLDGAIRNIEQAEAYQEYFAENNLTDEVAAIELALSDEESFNRLTKRRICGDCSEIIPWVASTRDLKTCPKCHGVLMLRPDDTEEVIEKRIKEQGNNAIRPVADYYAKLGFFKRIDGSKDIEEVEKEIDKALD